MKQAIYLFTMICLLVACGEQRAYRDALSRAEAAMNDHPDSALLILDSLGLHEAEFGRHFRMQYLLHRTNAQNKTDVVFTSDSLARELVDHFNSHGTANERVLANYLLGRALSDMGEAPAALQAYHAAINSVDTTDVHCDFAQLSKIYSQIGFIFYQQNLIEKQLEALDKAIYYSLLVGDTLIAILNYEKMSVAYDRRGNIDSAIQILDSVATWYKLHGMIQDAAISHGQAATFLVDLQKIDRAKLYMSEYERESGFFDSRGNIINGREIYYHYKGLSYLYNNNLDSAEYWFRHELINGKDYNNQNAAAKGLAILYNKKHQYDSAAVYAQYAYVMNDSVYAQMVSEDIGQMQAMYDYTRNQNIANQKSEEARKEKERRQAVVIVSLIIILAIYWLYRKNQQEKQNRIARLEEALSSAKSQRSTVQEELRKLKEKDYEGVIAEKEKQEAELTQTIERLQAENDQFRSKEHTKETDRLDDFLGSKIAQLFVKKAEGKAERPNPTEAEWKMLMSEFCHDNPVTFKSFGESRPLSQLEQRICVLLTLGIPEKTISQMTDASASTVSNAKSRANEKLYGKKDASSLKTNLIHALKRF